MTVQYIITQTGWQALTDVPEEQASSAYVCDLLSWAMSHVAAGTVWITVQAHINVIAVASLTSCACVVIPENIAVSQETLETARQKGVCVLSAPCSAYGAAAALFKLGIGEVSK